jgi:hypothetical protein
MVSVLYLMERSGAEVFLVMPTVSNILLGLFSLSSRTLSARTDHQRL